VLDTCADIWYKIGVGSNSDPDTDSKPAIERAFFMPNHFQPHTVNLKQAAISIGRQIETTVSGLPNS